MYNLGLAYRRGKGIEQNDTAAQHWFLLAADGGHTRAQYNVGQSYLRGIGARRNYFESVKWFRRAADKGFRRAQYRLGQAYRKGLGPRVNHQEAIRWYVAAAERGLDRAYYRLGRAYQDGQGVEQNPVEALKWFILSADSKSRKLRTAAVERRDDLIGKMSKTRAVEAERLAANWQPPSRLKRQVSVGGSSPRPAAGNEHCVGRAAH